MTTILYHKGILLADSRTTTRSRTGDEPECVKCGHSGARKSDDTTKLHIGDFKSNKFRGDPILAVGQVGKITVAMGLLRILRAGEDLEAYIRMASIAKHHHHITFGSGGLVIVGEKKVYHVKMLNADEGNFKNSFDVKEVSRADTLAVGSGGDYAMGYLKAIDDPWSALQAAIELDPSTGGLIRFIDFKEDNLRIQACEVSKMPDIKLTALAIIEMKDTKKVES
jgi:hypothetical protein